MCARPSVWWMLEGIHGVAIDFWLHELIWVLKVWWWKPKVVTGPVQLAKDDLFDWQLQVCFLNLLFNIFFFRRLSGKFQSILPHVSAVHDLIFIIMRNRIKIIVIKFKFNFFFFYYDQNVNTLHSDICSYLISSLWVVV